MTFLINLIFYLSFLTHKKSLFSALFYASLALSYITLLVTAPIEILSGVPLLPALFSVNEMLAAIVSMSLSAILFYYVSVRSKQYLVLDRYFRLMKPEIRKKKLLKYKVCVVLMMMLIPVFSMSIIYMDSN